MKPPSLALYPPTWMEESCKLLSVQLSVTVAVSDLEASLISCHNILVAQLTMVVIHFIWV